MTQGLIDPASVSALGGALRTHALRLVGLLDRLGEPTPGSRRPALPETEHERALIAAAATELDRVGATLQGLVTSDVERTARRRGLAEEAARHDLDIDGTRVTELAGPSRVEPRRRVQAREHLQELLNRVTAAEGRDLGLLSRDLEASLVVLAGVSAGARHGRA